MAAFPVEVLLGIYLGLLTGIIPAVVSWGLGFIFKYVTGISIPALAVVVLSLAIAGANGGLLALNDPTVRQAPNSVMLTTAIIVILMVSLYTHALGDRMGQQLPRHLSLRRLRERTLSADVVERVGGRRQVRVAVAGEVEDLEGYPPLSPELRETLRAEEWTLPADLPLSELERRIEDTLRTDHDLAEASVDVDERGRATVAAAPPTSGVSKRVPAGQRAVSVRGLVPTGLARGDAVTVHLPDGPVAGTVVSAQSALGGESAAPAPPSANEEAPAAESAGRPRAQTTEGGEGRVTLAVAAAAAERLLAVERAPLVVTSRGTRREFELISVLRRAGKRFRKLVVGAGADIAGSTIGEAAIQDTHGVAVLAIRRPDGWTLAPRGATAIAAGDELFVAGTPDAIGRFREVIA